MKTLIELIDQKYVLPITTEEATGLNYLRATPKTSFSDLFAYSFTNPPKSIELNTILQAINYDPDYIIYLYYFTDNTVVADYDYTIVRGDGLILSYIGENNTLLTFTKNDGTYPVCYIDHKDLEDGSFKTKLNLNWERPFITYGLTIERHLKN